MKMSGRHKKSRPRGRERTVSLVTRVLVTLVIAAGALLLFLSEGELLIVGLSLFMFAIGGLLLWLSPGRDDYSLDHRTGLLLDGLAESGFVALYDLQLGNRRLEYVLIGPPGVFVVRVDPRSRRAGRGRAGEDAEVHTLRELQEDVASLAKCIDHQVKPVLVTAREVEIDPPGTGDSIAVTRLESFLRTQSSRLGSSETGEILANVLRAAAKRASWDEGNDEGVNSS